MSKPTANPYQLPQSLCKLKSANPAPAIVAEVIISVNGLGTLVRLLPSLSPMVPNTAFCFFLIGLWYTLTTFQPSRLVKITHIISASWVFLMGIISALEYIFWVDLGIDQMLSSFESNIPELDSLVCAGRRAGPVCCGSWPPLVRGAARSGPGERLERPKAAWVRGKQTGM